MAEVAFTIGNRISYDRSLAENPKLQKLGQRLDEDPPYEGGWVWRTLGQASRFIEENPDLGFPPAVYAVTLPTGWVVDVSPEPHANDGVHRLLHDAVLLHYCRLCENARGYCRNCDPKRCVEVIPGSSTASGKPRQCRNPGHTVEGKGSLCYLHGGPQWRKVLI